MYHIALNTRFEIDQAVLKLIASLEFSFQNSDTPKPDQSNSLAFLPRFSLEVISGRLTAKSNVLPGKPSIQLPMLKRRNPNQIVRRIDRVGLSVILRRRPLDDMVNVIARLPIERRVLQIFQRFWEMKDIGDTCNL